MRIVTRLCISLDGYVTTPDGLPVQLADPSFVPGRSHGFPEFQQGLDAVLMGRSTFEPALGADRWPWPELGVFVLGSQRPDGTPDHVVVDDHPERLLARIRDRTGAATSTSSADRGRSRPSGRSAAATTSGCSCSRYWWATGCGSRPRSAPTPD